jgi:APA family basic amino acid/polyamine antiporter
VSNTIGSTSKVASASTTEPQLLRVVGRWDLVALVINGIVGAGIFGLPAKVHSLIGAWGILAIIACAILMLMVILCFAEVSSRFVETGGPFLYATEAFGPLAGFVSGWLLWIARIAGICAIAGFFAQYLALLFPAVGAGVPRALMLTAVVAGFTVLHISGVKRSVDIGNVITVAKLVPLVLLVIIGLPAINTHAINFAVVPASGNFSTAVLLLAFAFVGWETALVAAGESRDPRKDTPFALFVGLGAIALLYVGIQIVCVGLLPSLSTSTRPLADAALALVGPVGGTIIVVGASVSMLGTINGSLLTISRIPFAMAEAGVLPAKFAMLHPKYRTPVFSILFCAAIVVLLTLTNASIYVLTISTIARLLVFAITCAALPVLRRKEAVLPARFKLVGGATIPLLAFALIAWLVTSTSGKETRDVFIATLAGIALFFFEKRRRGASNASISV